MKNGHKTVMPQGKIVKECHTAKQMAAIIAMYSSRSRSKNRNCSKHMHAPKRIVSMNGENNINMDAE
jgi:hypothetical protein